VTWPPAWTTRACVQRPEASRAADSIARTGRRIAGDSAATTPSASGFEVQRNTLEPRQSSHGAERKMAAGTSEKRPSLAAVAPPHVEL
jgi:hypothetical protein